MPPKRKTRAAATVTRAGAVSPAARASANKGETSSQRVRRENQEAQAARFEARAAAYESGSPKGKAAAAAASSSDDDDEPEPERKTTRASSSSSSAKKKAAAVPAAERLAAGTKAKREREQRSRASSAREAQQAAKRSPKAVPKSSAAPARRAPTPRVVAGNRAPLPPPPPQAAPAARRRKGGSAGPEVTFAPAPSVTFSPDPPSYRSAPGPEHAQSPFAQWHDTPEEDERKRRARQWLVAPMTVAAGAAVVVICADLALRFWHLFALAVVAIVSLRRMLSFKRYDQALVNRMLDAAYTQLIPSIGQRGPALMAKDQLRDSVVRGNVAPGDRDRAWVVWGRVEAALEGDSRIRKESACTNGKPGMHWAWRSPDTKKPLYEADEDARPPPRWILF